MGNKQIRAKHTLDFKLLAGTHKRYHSGGKGIEYTPRIANQLGASGLQR